ncbi:MAG: 2-C-methyl-D-erythritol 2,4-cyclodiphosphate synthase [Deltaproteobacteria bacterium]|nr:2-C-methyl-D-erythritol 2,4-cyclodiphosphate synthase [Deltaproteobacteria bacterium]
MRIGHGYDVHRLTEGRSLVLGGVTIDNPKGLLGHSDADVLLHAITDSLLGAAALGDIGTHFPPSDDKYKDASSIELLKSAYKLVRDKGYKVMNIDSTIVCEAPKLLPHIPMMRDNVAKALGSVPDMINVKATTEEGLGFTGRGEAIAAHAIALIEAAE